MGNPQTKGLPLRQAVIRYQFPRSDDEGRRTPAEIVQEMCDMAVGWPLSPVRFLFNQDTCSFSVVSAATHGRTVGETYGTFFIGDDQPTVADPIDTQPDIELQHLIHRGFTALHADLKAALHRPWNAERLILWARRGSPSSEHAIVANDVLAQCEVSDWDKGHVRAGQEYFFDIHVQLQELPGIDQTAFLDDGRSPFPARHEDRAVKLIAEALRRDPDDRLPKAHYFAMVDNEGLRVSDEGKEKRVWPQARTAAGRPAQARGGRKPRTLIADPR